MARSGIGEPSRWMDKRILERVFGPVAIDFNEMKAWDRRRISRLFVHNTSSLTMPRVHGHKKIGSALR